MPKKSAARKKPADPGRFAHPFYQTSLEQRKATGGGRLLDHIKQKVQPIPKVKGTSSMTLSDIIGAASAQEIAKTNSLSFHSLGDSGRRPSSPEEDVSNAMAKDFDTTQPAKCPAFLFHLGDVCYGHNKTQECRQEFYEPYAHYPGKIIAIPGNHDGEVFPGTDPLTLKDFIANFCAASQKVPPIAGTIYRETMNQPGVYWFLDAPFVQIIGLYSNAAENPGFISGDVPGQAQLQWLQKTLAGVKAARGKGQRKALVIATHHPPFTSGGHSPSTEMLAEIDHACAGAGVQPDLFLSGHAHSYQRYTRFVPQGGKTLEIPYLVVGTGGVGEQAVQQATGARTGDHTYLKSMKGYGYLLVTVTATTLTAKYVAVDGANTKDFDTVTVDLSANKVL